MGNLQTYTIRQIEYTSVTVFLIHYVISKVIYVYVLHLFIMRIFFYLKSLNFQSKLYNECLISAMSLCSQVVKNI